MQRMKEEGVVREMLEDLDIRWINQFQANDLQYALPIHAIARDWVRQHIEILLDKTRCTYAQRQLIVKWIETDEPSEIAALCVKREERIFSRANLAPDHLQKIIDEIGSRCASSFPLWARLCVQTDDQTQRRAEFENAEREFFEKLTRTSVSRMPFAHSAWFVENINAGCDFTMGMFKQFPSCTSTYSETFALCSLKHATHASNVESIIRPDGLHFKAFAPTQYCSNKRLCWFSFSPEKLLHGHRLFGSDSSVYGPVEFAFSAQYFQKLAHNISKLGSRSYQQEICHAYVMAVDPILLNGACDDTFPQNWTCNWDKDHYEQFDLAIVPENGVELVIPFEFLCTVRLVKHSSCVMLGRKGTCTSSKFAEHKDALYQLIESLLPVDSKKKLQIE